MNKIESVGWGFGRCNMDCENCYHASCQSSNEYPLKTLIRIANIICPQIKDINYGTGEFLYNSRALDLAEYVAANYPDVFQAITTNGFSLVAVGEEKIKRLFHDIDVSLDFPDPESHNESRGHTEAWKWAIESLGICKELGIETTIVNCLTSKITDRHILEFLELAAKYNTSFRLSWFRKTGRGKDSLRLSTKRFWEIIRLLSENAIFESLSDPLLSGILNEGSDSNCQGCPCGTLSCRIQTNLKVTPCVFLKGKK